MTLAPGARLGPYEIVASLGKGGMGEVYRARDTRLERTVAIKVLAAHRINDPQMRQRFEREARAVAALNHPHICHLNDVGQHDSVDFLVMEYVKGETLAARLTRAGGALSLEETLRHGVEIAEALAAAHQQGIVHRDLKPANVMLTSAGVKLLDFGLAKLSDPNQDSLASLSTLSPTRKDPLTNEGSILGTWPYMAPEQIEGKAVDARADIFAFGAVLYEMATGRRAFEGDSHASLIAAILERDPPPLTQRQGAAPHALERIVRKCLQKRPEARWQSARDLADALKWIVEEGTQSAHPGTKGYDGPRPTSHWRWIGAVGAVTVALGLVVFVWNLARPSVARDMPVRRFVIEPGARDRIAGLQFALSPDGRALVYPAVGERGASLQLRLLDQLAAQPIPGIEGAHDPTFSPDSQWIAFFVGPTLKKVSRTSGAPPITLAEFPGLVDKSIAWLPDDTIVVGRVAAGLFRVSAEGGTPIQLSTPDVAHGVIDHHTPRWLPGGNALLITRHRGPETWDVAALDTRTGAIREIVSDAFDARYLPTGHLVFARGQALLAAPFDVTTLALTGPPVVMVDRISANLNNGAARYDVSGDGLLAYIPAIPRGGRRLAWVGPNAAIEPLPVGPRAFSQPSLSPDGGRVAVGIEDGARRDIWIYELASGVLSRLTSDGASESPIWTRDGRRVTFSKIKDGRRELYWQRVDGTSPAERLVTDPYSVFPGSWSAHGRRLVFTRQPPTDQTDIGLFDADVGSTTMTIASDKQEEQPRFSTDGRWLAYTTYETPERSDVFIASLDGSTQRQISVDGGFAPVWRPDGRVLYYRFVPRSIMAVDVSRFPTTIGRPTPIVKDAPFVLGSAFGHPGYDGAADGRLLVVQAGAEEAAPPRFEIVLNWFEELKQRVPVRGRD